MRNPFKREKALTGTGDAVAAIRSGTWNPFPLLGGGAPQRIQNAFNRAQSAHYGWMYANSPAVRTVIDVIVRNVGELELRLYEELSESERQPRPDHPAALSLRYPNEETTQDSFIRSMFKDFLIHDNAYAVMIPAGDQIRFLRIPAYMVEVMGPSLFDVSVYRVWPQGAWTNTGTWGGFGTPTDFLPEQVMHWHGEHPLDPRVGLSKLDTLRDVIAEDAALQQATVELAQSGLQEPVWVSRPETAPEISNDTLMALEQDLQNRTKRRNEKPIVLAEGMRFESFGISPQDAQMLEVRRWSVERVATAFGVPLAIVGGGSGRAENLPDAQMQLYTDVLLPYCEEFTRMLNLRVLVRAYNWTEGCFEFSFDEKLMGNDRLRAFVTATGRPVMLTNEARAKMNLPPVDGGDDLVTPANVLVGDNPLPAPGIMPVQDPNAPAQDGSYRSDQGSATEVPKALTEGKQLTIDGPIRQLHPRRDGDIRRQHRHIDEVQAVVQRHFNRMERLLRAKANKRNSQLDWTRFDTEFGDDLNQQLKHIVALEGGLYALRLGGHEFDMERVQNYVKAMAEGAATAINDSLRSEIGSLGLDAALNRVPTHVANSGTSLGASSTIWAREEAARQTPDGGANRIKSWVADGQRHAELDGLTIGLNEPWPSGFGPGGQPGCRCTASVS